LKAGFALLLGRPSAGKSTLLNNLLDFKVSIVSPTPQTTRKQVRGIWSAKDIQVVILDTPGYHQSVKTFNQKMMNQIRQGIEDSDFILYIMDLARAPGQEEKGILALLKTASCPILKVFNKIDLEITHQSLYRELLQEFEIQGPEVEVSGKTSKGFEKLKEQMEILCPEGEPFYPEDYLTDQSPEFRVAEMIREQVFLTMSQEIPHSVFVEVSDIELREGNKMWIRAFLIAERESQKGILVGKGGVKIKEIRQTAQKELGKIFTPHYPID